MWIRLLATVVAVTGVTGCYTRTVLPPIAIASVTVPLARPTTLGLDGRLGPRTDVRVRFGDGSTSRWWPASTLAVGNEGVIVGSGRYRLADAREAVISGADAGAGEVLAATAPPGASITRGEHRLRLRLTDPRMLLSWIAAYVNGAAALGREPGALSFRGPEGVWESPPIPGGRLAALTDAGLEGASLAEGVLWREVSFLELDNLDPWSTIGAVIGVPLAAVILMPLGAGVPLGAAVEKPFTDLWLPEATGSDQGTEGYWEGPDDSPAPVGHHRRTAVLLDRPKDDPHAPVVVPLFTSSARRRDQVKVVLGGDFGVESAEDMTFTGSAGVGLRLFDFLEVTGRVRSVTFDDWGPAAGAGSPGTGLSRHLLGGGRLSLHLDADGNPATAFVAGGEVLAGSLEGGGTLTELGFVLGPRYGLTDKLFASFLFAPSILISSNTGTVDHSRGRLMFCAELAFDL